jgi:hypothetical protein
MLRRVVSRILTDVPEVLMAIGVMMMEAGSASETSVNI